MTATMTHTTRSIKIGVKSGVTPLEIIIVTAGSTPLLMKNGRSKKMTFCDDNSYDTIVKKSGNTMIKIWCNDAYRPHRDGDLPAVILADGSAYYFKDGKQHRDGDLPAVIRADGLVEYWVEGKRIK